MPQTEQKKIEIAKEVFETLIRCSAYLYAGIIPKPTSDVLNNYHTGEISDPKRYGYFSEQEQQNSNNYFIINHKKLIKQKRILEASRETYISEYGVIRKLLKLPDSSVKILDGHGYDTTPELKTPEIFLRICWALLDEWSTDPANPNFKNTQVDEDADGNPITIGDIFSDHQNSKFHFGILTEKEKLRAKKTLAKFRERSAKNQLEPSGSLHEKEIELLKKWGAHIQPAHLHHIPAPDTLTSTITEVTNTETTNPTITNSETSELPLENEEHFLNLTNPEQYIKILHERGMSTKDIFFKAIQDNRLDVIKHFCRKQAKMFLLKNHDGLTVLHWAAQNNHPEIIDLWNIHNSEMLRKYPNNVKTIIKDASTLAITNSNYLIAYRLEDTLTLLRQLHQTRHIQDHSIDFTADELLLPVHLPERSDLNLEPEQYIKNLQDHGLSMDNIFLQAAKDGRVDVVAGFVERSWSRNLNGPKLYVFLIKDNDRLTALHWAAKNGHLNVVKCLVEKGELSVSDLDKDGLTPLHWAAKNNHLEIISWILNNTYTYSHAYNVSICKDILLTIPHNSEVTDLINKHLQQLEKSHNSNRRRQN